MYFFIYIGSCTLELKTNECANLEITVSIQIPDISEEACKIKCMVHARSNEQCWALTFNNLTGTCIIHERLQLQTTCKSSLRFYTKVCFTYSEYLNYLSRFRAPSYLNYPSRFRATSYSNGYIEPIGSFHNEI